MATITTTLPNANNITGTAEESGAGNMVIYASTKGRYSYPTHTTPFLFLTNYAAEGSYTINKQPVTVNDNIFYLLQTGSNLSINFRTAMPLQTLIILFDEDFISNAILHQTIGAAQLLHNPQPDGTKSIDIPSVPFLHTAKMHYLLGSITQNLFMEGIVLQDILHEIITEFCYINTDTAKQIQKINAIKAATREELYRRLTTAKLFMHDNACNNITIAEIAAAACLNPFHFLRVFKCAYQTTPHQYLMNLKLEKARGLLRQQQHPVADVCMMVGFESMGSFSNLFKKRFGVSPSSIGKR